MSNKGFWDSDNVSEYEFLQEDMEDAMMSAEEMAEEIADELEDEEEYEEPELLDASEEQIEAIQEAAQYNLDEKETNVVFNARLRLEQAKLYEMLINHPIFDGVDVSDEAVNVVSEEIKHFIVKRLELLLGMRKPRPKVQQVVDVELPFNDVEIDALKQLAFKMSKGQSATAAPVRVSAQPTIKPLSGSTSSGLNTLRQKPAPQPQPVQQPTPQPAKKPQAAAPKRKVRKGNRKTTAPREKIAEATQPKKKPTKNSKAPKLTPSGRGRRLTQAEIMELAKADLADMQSRKPIAKLKGKARQKAIKEVNDKHARKAKPDPATFPSIRQQQMQYAQMQANGANPNDVLDGMANNLIKEARNIGKK